MSLQCETELDRARSKPRSSIFMCSVNGRSRNRREVVPTRSGPFYSGQHHLLRSSFEPIWRP